MLCLRRTALFAMIPLIVVAVATSCDDDPTRNSETADSGAQPGQLAGGVCPLEAPAAGEGCTVPEGTTCSFGTCSEAKIVQCSRGTWHLGGNPTISKDAAVCPVLIPAKDASCDCFPEDIACRYGTCESADATAQVASASCRASVWVVETIETCPPREADSGPKDAGADVQGDADADVD